MKYRMNRLRQEKSLRSLICEKQNVKKKEALLNNENVAQTSSCCRFKVTGCPMKSLCKVGTTKNVSV